MASVPQILKGEGETLLLHSHLMQMLTFVRGGGVEFLPNVDQGDIRKNFLDRLARESKLPLKTRSMIIRMIGQGRFILYLRPTGTFYRIESYPREQYRAYYDANGDLDAVVVVYSYKRRQVGGQPMDRWVRLRITAQAIEKTESDGKLEFEQEGKSPDSVVPNSLGFLPCVEVLNPPPASENLGESDFEALSAQIEAHDELTTAILDNLDFFAYSPIVTSEDPSEISDLKANSRGIDRDSVASISGFGDMPQPFKNSVQQRRRDRRLKKIIGPFEDTSSIQQLQIQPVPPNQIAFADNYERQLRESMGGILERGIETATESRLVYGKVEVTAREKREALFTYGICKILEMAILAEEALYVASGQRQGLPPMGDRAISYRVAPVFVQTAKDIQDRSIVGRNLQELGVNAKETLKFVLPHLRETEIDKMVGNSGLPFRYLQQTMTALQQMSGLIDPMTGLPLLDPRTGLPLVYGLIPKLLESLDYGSEFNPAEPPSPTASTTESDALAGAIRRIANRQRQQQRAQRVESVGSGDSGESVQLPEPGSTVSAGADDTSPPAAPIANPTPTPGLLDWQRSPILNFIKRGW